jgi:hypothetical protein
LIKGGSLCKNSVALAASILAAAILAAGCGSSEAETSKIGKAEFVKEANALCRARQKKRAWEGLAIRRKAESTGESSQDADVATVLTVLVPFFRSTAEEIQALGPPRADEDQVNAIVGAMKKLADKAEADPARYLHELINFERPYRAPKRLADEYGITECVEPGGTLE